MELQGGHRGHASKQAKQKGRVVFRRLIMLSSHTSSSSAHTTTAQSSRPCSIPVAQLSELRPTVSYSRTSNVNQYCAAEGFDETGATLNLDEPRAVNAQRQSQIGATGNR